MEDNMKKKHVSLLLAAAMAASVISGCGSSANNSTAETTKAEGAAAETTAAGETEATAEAVEDTEKNETDEVVIATPRDAVQGSGDAYYCWEWRLCMGSSHSKQRWCDRSVACKILGAQR